MPSPLPACAAMATQSRAAGARWATGGGVEEGGVAVAVTERRGGRGGGRWQEWETGGGRREKRW